MKRLLWYALLVSLLMMLVFSFAHADEGDVVMSVDSPSATMVASLTQLGEEEADGCGLSITDADGEDLVSSGSPVECNYLGWTVSDGHEMVVTKSYGQTGITFPVGNPYTGGDVHSIEFVIAEMYFGYYLTMQCTHGLPEMVELVGGIDEDNYGTCSFGDGPVSIEHVWFSSFSTVHHALELLEEEDTIATTRVDFYEAEEGTNLYPMMNVRELADARRVISEFSPSQVVNLQGFGLVAIGVNQDGNAVALTFSGDWLDVREVSAP